MGFTQNNVLHLGTVHYPTPQGRCLWVRSRNLENDACGGFGRHCVIFRRAVLDWRKRGVRVMAWTVNTPVEKQYLARVLKITYLTDTLTGEGTTHSPPL
jgi:hypothetical protein